MATIKAEYKVRPHEDGFAVYETTRKQIVSVHKTAADAAKAMQRLKQRKKKQYRQ